MAHKIICQYCKETFDRDNIPYVQVSNMRYGHADCYLKLKEENKIKNELEIIYPEIKVKCFYCKNFIDKNSKDCEEIGTGRFAHKQCIEKENKREKTDKEKLDIYICQLYDVDFVPPIIQKQINSFLKQYQYSYSGMMKALKYYYEYKKQPLDKNNQSVGIIPYIYKEAYNYYYELWLAQEKNKIKNISKFIPKQINIIIKPPIRKVKLLKNTFNFLERDEIINDE